MGWVPQLLPPPEATQEASGWLWLHRQTSAVWPQWFSSLPGLSEDAGPEPSHARVSSSEDPVRPLLTQTAPRFHPAPAEHEEGALSAAGGPWLPLPAPPGELTAGSKAHLLTQGH